MLPYWKRWLHPLSSLHQHLPSSHDDNGKLTLNKGKSSLTPLMSTLHALIIPEMISQQYQKRSNKVHLHAIANWPLVNQKLKMMQCMCLSPRTILAGCCIATLSLPLVSKGSQLCILPGELENQEAHQAERRQQCTPPNGWKFPKYLLWISLLICGGSGAGMSCSKHCYLWWFWQINFRFSENKSHSTDDGLERLKRQHCQASLSRKTCIRLKAGQREMCKSSFVSLVVLLWTCV
jgi:hypothetical protein